MLLFWKWYSEFSLKVPNQDWLGKFCIFDSKIALMISGKYQNKEKPLKCQRRLGLPAMQLIFICNESKILCLFCRTSMQLCDGLRGKLSCRNILGQWCLRFLSARKIVSTFIFGMLVKNVSTQDFELLFLVISKYRVWRSMHIVS